jgi:hypothetical protein
LLVSKSESYMKAAFTDESEIERVVQTYAEQLFGSSILYLPQTRISTIGGRGTIPDAIVLDIGTNEWYLVEAERAIHGTWEHIAPQVSRHLAAVAAPRSLEVVIELALDLLRSSSDLREMFRDVGISELEIHGRLQGILRKAPTIAIPIDALPRDLAEWAQTLRNNVKIWVLEKYVSTSDPNRILYSLPDENFPTLSTSPASAGVVSDLRTAGSQPFQELINAMPQLVGQKLRLEYGPRGGERRTFEGVFRPDGVEVDGKVYSPSYAAVYCIQKAGSPRKTANGWIMWRTEDGDFLADLYGRLRSDQTRSENAELHDDRSASKSEPAM